MARKKITSIEQPKSPVAEAYRGIRTNIEFSNVDKELKVITVTSSQQNEGKSTVIANIAVSFANLGKKVLLLEGDLRNPSVHRMFNITNAKGVTDILLNSKEIVDCINVSSYMKNLHIITGGKIPPNPSEMLSSNKMKSVIKSLKECYDYIFIDAPPIGIITDAGIISTYSDGCIFVVGANEVDVEMTKIAKDRLEKVNANILGVVLNKYQETSGSYGYYNYYYYSQEK
ncbi:MAG: CpsD/CapB family tyrosine-protein kinase [Peptostreptococcaceae bacterium]